jgi:hypothetical protein
MKKYFEPVTKGLLGIHGAYFPGILLFTMLMMSNCFCIIGYGLGASLDNKGRNIRNLEKAKIEHGQEMKVLLRDNRIIEGQYNGREIATLDNYVIPYELSKAELSDVVTLPKIGDTVYFSLKSGDSLHMFKNFGYKFQGFESGNFLVSSKTNNSIGRIPFSIIDKMLDNYGNSTTGSKASELLNMKIIPSRSVIELKNGINTSQFDPGQVLQANIKSKSKNAKWRGLLIGLGFEMAIAWWSISNFTLF